MLLKKENIQGHEVDVEISDAGLFRIKLNNEQLAYASSLDDALTKARQVISKRKVKVAVSFWTMPSALKESRYGVATGIHAGHGKIVARVADVSVNIETHAQVLKADTPAEQRDRLKTLYAEIAERETEVRQIRRQYELHLGVAVRAEIDRAAEALATTAA